MFSHVNNRQSSVPALPSSSLSNRLRPSSSYQLRKKLMKNVQDAPHSPSPHTENDCSIPKTHGSVCFSIDCILNDDSLPIVGEVEHKVGYCYCHHCTCGEHVCPGQMKPALSSPSYKTVYSSEFPSHKVQRSRGSLQAYSNQFAHFKSSTFSSSSETTYKNEFKQFKIEASRGKNKEKQQKTQLKMLSNSSYARDFARWNSETHIVKPPVLPYRGNMVQFSGQTTYSSSFKEVGKLGSTHQLRSTQSVRQKLPFSFVEGYPISTTSKSSYQNTFAESMKYNRGVCRSRVNSVTEACAIRSPGRTIYQSEFVNQQVPTKLSRKKNK